ncbi:FAD:protein FMN transferase, partial [bacterium]|nr:FAD:protein FMN transferase [bacterium]
MIKLRFCLFFIFILLAGCSKQSPVVKQSRLLMGTVVEIKVVGKDQAKAKEALNKAFGEIEKVNSLMSTYIEESEVSLLNREGEAKVSKETLEVIEEALKISSLSQGAFDITVRPLINLWRRAGKEKKLPSREEIEGALSLAGFEGIEIKEDVVSLKSAGMEIDLGGIAKGYAVDKAIEALKDAGIENALVNAGGDIYALGLRSSKKPWTIGIRHPREKNKILATVKVTNKAVTTSGDYERYFMLGGVRYSHIISPKTGYPVSEVPMSVSIIAQNCTLADALATACFVLGPDEGIKLIESLGQVEGMIIGNKM